MPFPLLAHQLPVLPLKLAAPRRVSGTALCFGSIAPDVELFVTPNVRDGGFAHSLLGQFVFCLPVALALTWVFRAMVARPLARELPRGTLLHFEDLAMLGDPPRGAHAWFIAAASALVGSFSHIVLDAFTHRGGWGTRWFPVLDHVVRLGSLPITVTRILQYTVSVVGAVASAWILVAISRRRLLLVWSAAPAPALPAPRPVVRSLLALAVIAGVALGVVTSRGAIAQPWLYWENARLYVWGFVLFRATCFAFVLVALVCALARERVAKAEPAAPSSSVS